MSQLLESRTWWLRLEISRQLPDFAALLSNQVVLAVLAPLFLTLLTDPVCSVREMTYRRLSLNRQRERDIRGASALAGRKPAARRASALPDHHLREVAEVRRPRGASEETRSLQIFLMCCPSFVPLLSKNSFKQLIRPVIVYLARDRVPAVRQMALEMILNEPGTRQRGIRA